MKRKAINGKVRVRGQWFDAETAPAGVDVVPGERRAAQRWLRRYGVPDRVVAERAEVSMDAVRQWLRGGHNGQVHGAMRAMNCPEELL